MGIVIVSCKSWHKKYVPEIAARTGQKVTYLEDKNAVTYENFQKLAPTWVFFPHWSYIIPSAIYENFRCVIFHMTDLPFGRGGSPLQNLIARGIYETQISALRCEKELDAGPIYLNRPFSLWGSAEEIFLRGAEITKEMLIEIVQKKPTPIPQKGTPVVFKRRKPAEGNMAELSSLEKVFDYIRMLDAEGYPQAFLETPHLKFEFSRAAYKEQKVLADVKITLKDKTGGN